MRQKNLLTNRWVKVPEYIQPEKDICKDIWKHFKLCVHHDVFMFHVVNEGKRERGERISLFNMGLVRGVPDYVMFHKGKAFTFEGKRPKKGQETPEQESFRLWADMNGLPHRIVKSLDDYRQLLIDWEIPTREVVA